MIRGVLFGVVLWGMLLFGGRWVYGQVSSTQVQICTATPNSTVAGAVTGCAPGNLSWGPLSGSSLTRTIVNGKQTWIAFNQLTPGNLVMVKGASWEPLSGLKITVPVASPPVSPPVVTPPTPAPDYSKITGFLVEHSSDAGASWESVAAWRVSSGPDKQCFRITPQEGNAVGPAMLVCPLP